MKTAPGLDICSCSKIVLSFPDRKLKSGCRISDLVGKRMSLIVVVDSIIMVNKPRRYTPLKTSFLIEGLFLDVVQQPES